MAAKAGVFLTLIFGSAIWAQTVPPDEPIVVSTEHPRLFLRPARLRTLKRERDRGTVRWQQFATLMAEHTPMPEPALAGAMYYQVAGDADSGRSAISWALGPDSDLRQQALVFDWCQDLLTEAQQHALMDRMQKEMSQSASDDRIPAVRSRLLAAIVLFDHVPGIPGRELNRIVRGWWDGKMVPALAAGTAAVPRDETFDLYELLHAMRDNTNLDLRESARAFFEDLPTGHLISYYPAPYEAPENDYYLGAQPQAGEPDTRKAARSRIAGLAMVAYDTNALQSQILQGWLMHDRFILRGAFGAPYEFLWANPYQPGLSYYHAPLAWHSSVFGKLFVRASWDDGSDWFGDFDGVMQWFHDGHLAVVTPGTSPAPIPLGNTAVCFAHATHRFSVGLEEDSVVYIVGLEPHHTYQIEVDDEEMYDAESDSGGILEVEVPGGRKVGVRFK